MTRTKMINLLRQDGYGEAADYILSLEEKLEAQEPMIFEYCHECDNEIKMQWDISKRGYEAYCPVCGEKLDLS